MATNNLIQRLPMKDETLTTTGESHRRVVEQFIATEAIADREWVQFATGKTGPEATIYVSKAAHAADGGNPLVVGVYIANKAGVAAAANDRINVVTSGYVDNAVMHTSIAAGKLIAVVSGTGQANGKALVVPDIDTSGSSAKVPTPCGVTLKASGSDLFADCIVLPRFA